MAHLFPIYLNLAAKKCLIVGGGKVAERKAENLLEYGADIMVVCPEAVNNIQNWSRQGFLTLVAREFQAEDLKDVFMVFLATDDREVNQQVVDLCRERGILINAVDDPPHCDFYVPALIRRQSLAVAISTEGKSPLFASRLRQELEEIITEEYGEFVELLGSQRDIVKEQVAGLEERKKVFAALVYSDILELLKAGEKEKVRERITQCMSSLQD